MINSGFFQDKIFKNAIVTFQDASSNMINYQTNVIDFDKVKEDYCQKYKACGKASQSVDALVVDKNNRIIFIEFKNGNLKNKKSKLKSKLRDSLLIFNDLNNLKLDFSRKNCEYILVYNYDKNINLVQTERREAGLMMIQNTLANLGGQEFVHFGLHPLKGVFVSEVHTYSKQDFDSYYQKYLIGSMSNGVGDQN